MNMLPRTPRARLRQGKRRTTPPIQYVASDIATAMILANLKKASNRQTKLKKPKALRGRV